MVELNDKGLDKKLRKLERQHIPNVTEIKEENEVLTEEEKKFRKRFLKKTR